MKNMMLTATHLSEVLDGAISHDKITRMLAQPALSTGQAFGAIHTER